jgi:hypothetical protein
MKHATELLITFTKFRYLILPGVCSSHNPDNFPNFSFKILCLVIRLWQRLLPRRCQIIEFCWILAYEEWAYCLRHLLSYTPTFRTSVVPLSSGWKNELSRETRRKHAGESPLVLWPRWAFLTCRYLLTSSPEEHHRSNIWIRDSQMWRLWHNINTALA